MAKVHKDHELHIEVFYEFLRDNNSKTLIEIFKKIGKDQELVKKLDLTKYNNPDGILRHEAKTRINIILKQLKKDGRIETIENEDKGTIYQIIKKEQGSQELTIIKEKKKKDKSNNEQWVFWTQPIFVKENNRWEYYQKNERGEILEIYHSEDQAELKIQFDRKVSEHIMAAMHNENKPQEEKKKQPYKRTEKNIIKGHGNPQESSAYIHEQAQMDMMDMKVKGESIEEIFKTVKQRYNYSQIQVGLLYVQVLNFIKEKVKDLIEDTMRVHSERYEELYKWFNENGYSKHAIRALERKEKMMGLTEEEINNKLLTNALGDRTIGIKKYVYEQLSESELEELVQLVRISFIKKE